MLLMDGDGGAGCDGWRDHAVATPQEAGAAAAAGAGTEAGAETEGEGERGGEIGNKKNERTKLGNFLQVE